MQEDSTTLDQEQSASHSTDILAEAIKKQTFEEAVKGLGVDALRLMLFDKYKFLENGYKNIEERLNKVADRSSADNIALTQRVEKLLNLMTNHMLFIHQMVELLDDYGGRLDKLEKGGDKYQSECAMIIDRMNKMNDNYTKLANNTQNIVDEISKLKVRQDASEKFRWKLTVLAAISTSIISWLLLGDNLTKLIKAVQFFMNGHQ